MATWPTFDEALAYIGEVNDEQYQVLDSCLSAATDYIAWRCNGNIEVTVADPLTDPPVVGDIPIVRDTLREACLLLTSRLFRRRLSPEGVAGFGDFGAVRVTRLDPDIERLITPARSWGIA